MSRIKLTSNQSGFEHASLILAVLVLAVVGFVGYRVMQRSATNTATTTPTTTAIPASVPNTITTKAQLTQASRVLDQSSSQLNSSLNGGALDTDISSML